MKTQDFLQCADTNFQEVPGQDAQLLKNSLDLVSERKPRFIPEPIGRFVVDVAKPLAPFQLMVS
jgi:hypothetical protein